MRIIHLHLLLVLVLLFHFGCKKEDKRLFTLVSSEDTGITFENSIESTDSLNILTYEYIYNGGGVGIGDFNNDSMPDIFFTGNLVPNALYLNQGNFQFKDISKKANISLPGRWNSGVAVIDINNDGWMDLYVCATASPDSTLRTNMLFVNQGLDDEGDPTFKEMAADYNIDYDGHSISSAFFDYDRDGDLDLYILVNEKLLNAPTNFREKIVDGSAANNDRFFRNDGNGKFTDVTMEAGIVYEGYGLGLAICDFNNDGWSDIYVSNDYQSNDILYINQKNGTFINATAGNITHQSQFSMGNDAADINNDGMSDLITIDMLPENSERKKTTIGNKSYQTYINNEKYQYDYQYVRNMLHINNGMEAGIKFSEIGQLSGIHQTEWSWSPLFVDFDNDQFRDLVITNGFPKDITDKDFANYRAEIMNIASPGYLEDSIPVVKISNYAYRNRGDLTFEDVSSAWGMNTTSFSNGAAFADFDGDGDVDYVINNINDKAFVYRNNLYSNDKEKTSNYLRIKLVGSAQNKMGLGTKLHVYRGGKMQYHDHSIYRGYMSSVENVIHFGVGDAPELDSIRIEWPDGQVQVLRHVKTNQVLTIDYKNSAPYTSAVKGASTLLLTAVNDISFLHKQNDVIDFNMQRTIPHKFSQYGPALAVGDINNDGREDVYVGGSHRFSGRFLMQQANGTFKEDSTRLKNKQDGLTSETGTLLFDADTDGDLDLYLVRGGFEWPDKSPNYIDALFLNDGKGYFKPLADALPSSSSSGSCVRAADFDGDSDLDLFVGGRVVPVAYPLAPESIILKNENGKFTNVTDQICPAIKTVGMVTDAVWTDFDNDGKVDLVIAGELMALKFVKNNGSSMEVLSTDADRFKGWWNSIVPFDFDSDGDIDFMAGNLGDNNPYHASDSTPVQVIAKDLDNNGSIEAITACYSKMLDGSLKLCPVHFWDELNQQSPKFRRQFRSYKSFSKSTMATLLSEKDREGAVVLEANYSLSSYIENLGNGRFKVSPLPVEAQLAPVNGILIDDVNNDGNADALLIGNDYGNEVFVGRYDAFTGLVLLGNGKGGFTAVGSSASGFYVPHDAKAIVHLPVGDHYLTVASQNRDRLLSFVKSGKSSAQIFKPEALDASLVLRFPDGKQQKVTLSYGAGFLSQSSRVVLVPKGVAEIEIIRFDGKTRKIQLSSL